MFKCLKNFIKNIISSSSDDETPDLCKTIYLLGHDTYNIKFKNSKPYVHINIRGNIGEFTTLSIFNETEFNNYLIDGNGNAYINAMYNGCGFTSIKLIPNNYYILSLHNYSNDSHKIELTVFNNYKL